MPPAILSPQTRALLFDLPADHDEAQRRYALAPEDLALARRHRRRHNRLGFAVQLALMHDLGRPLRVDEQLSTAVIEAVAEQLGVEPGEFDLYARRDETRREHAGEIAACAGRLAARFDRNGDGKAATASRRNRGARQVAVSFTCQLALPEAARPRRACLRPNDSRPSHAEGRVMDGADGVGGAGGGDYGSGSGDVGGMGGTGEVGGAGGEYGGVGSSEAGDFSDAMGNAAAEANAGGSPSGGSTSDLGTGGGTTEAGSTGAMGSTETSEVGGTAEAGTGTAGAGTGTTGSTGASGAEIGSAGPEADGLGGPSSPTGSEPSTASGPAEVGSIGASGLDSFGATSSGVSASTAASATGTVGSSGLDGFGPGGPTGDWSGSPATAGTSAPGSTGPTTAEASVEAEPASVGVGAIGASGVDAFGATPTGVSDELATSAPGTVGPSGPVGDGWAGVGAPDVGAAAATAAPGAAPGATPADDMGPIGAAEPALSVASLADLQALDTPDRIQATTATASAAAALEPTGLFDPTPSALQATPLGPAPTMTAGLLDPAPTVATPAPAATPASPAPSFREAEIASLQAMNAYEKTATQSLESMALGRATDRQSVPGYAADAHTAALDGSLAAGRAADRQSMPGYAADSPPDLGGSLAAGRAADRQSVPGYADASVEPSPAPSAAPSPSSSREAEITSLNAYDAAQKAALERATATTQAALFGAGAAARATASMTSIQAIEEARAALSRAGVLHSPAIGSLSFPAASPFQQATAIARGMYGPLDWGMTQFGVRSPLTSAAQVYNPSAWSYSTAAKSTQALLGAAPTAYALNTTAKALGWAGLVAGPAVNAVFGYYDPVNQTRTDRWTGAVMGALRGLDNGAVQLGGATFGAIPGAAAGAVATAPTGGWGAIPGGFVGAGAGGLALGNLYSGSAFDRGFNAMVGHAEPGVRSAVGVAERAYDWASPTVSYGYNAVTGTLGWAYDQVSGALSGGSNQGPPDHSSN